MIWKRLVKCLDWCLSVQNSRIISVCRWMGQKKLLTSLMEKFLVIRKQSNWFLFSSILYPKLIRRLLSLTFSLALPRPLMPLCNWMLKMAATVSLLWCSCLSLAMKRAKPTKLAIKPFVILAKSVFAELAKKSSRKMIAGNVSRWTAWMALSRAMIPLLKL